MADPFSPLDPALTATETTSAPETVSAPAPAPAPAPPPSGFPIRMDNHTPALAQSPAKPDIEMMDALPGYSQTPIPNGPILPVFSAPTFNGPASNGPSAAPTPIRAPTPTPLAAPTPMAMAPTSTAGTPSRINSPHHSVGPTGPPAHPTPHGGPTRLYLNQNVTPHLLEAMKHLVTIEPDKPLKWLSEFLAQKSLEIEGPSEGTGR